MPQPLLGRDGLAPMQVDHDGDLVDVSPPSPGAPLGRPRAAFSCGSSTSSVKRGGFSKCSAPTQSDRASVSFGDTKPPKPPSSSRALKVNSPREAMPSPKSTRTPPPVNVLGTSSSFLTEAGDAQAAGAQRIESCSIPDDFTSLPNGANAPEAIRAGLRGVKFASGLHESRFVRCWLTGPAEALLTAFVWRTICTRFVQDEEAADRLFSTLATYYTRLCSSSALTSESKDTLTWYLPEALVHATSHALQDAFPRSRHVIDAKLRSELFSEFISITSGFNDLRHHILAETRGLAACCLELCGLLTRRGLLIYLLGPACAVQSTGRRALNTERASAGIELETAGCLRLTKLAGPPADPLWLSSHGIARACTAPTCTAPWLKAASASCLIRQVAEAHGAP